MGQKVNPNGLRIGINRDYSSKWYADKKDFATFLDEDIKIRSYLEPLLDKANAGLSHIDIERIKEKVKITIYVSAPGVIAKEKATGEDTKEKPLIVQIKKKLSKILHKAEKDIEIPIVQVNNPDLDAVLVAKDIARQLQERASYRVVQKKALQRVMRAGAKGCKTMTKGRIGGAEIARYEEYKEGVLSLHTLRQPIDYAYVPCKTTYGVIGVKVWIALPDNYQELRERRPDEARNRSGRNFKGRNSRPSRPAQARSANNEQAVEEKGE